MIDGTRIKGRPDREWLDDVRDWARLDVQKLSLVAQD